MALSRHILQSTLRLSKCQKQMPRMMYHGQTSSSPSLVNAADNNGIVIDIRSDTVTKPNKAMRQAMHDAQVGDDVYGEDPIVNALQERCAQLFNKESALFIPTGTMGNLIALMTHCHSRGLECILGDRSHIFLYEQGGMSQIAGVQPRTLTNRSDGTFDLHEAEYRIRVLDDVHQPWTKLICIENTHNVCGGRVIHPEFIKRTQKLANNNQLLVHIDGARLMNAAVSLDVPISDFTNKCDSVTMCFSKGLGAPVGSILAGTEEFIQKALRVRKALGGGMRQAGILAAAANVALDEAREKLRTDHRHAKYLATEIVKEDQSVLHIDLNGVETNIVMMNVIKDNIDASMFCDRMAEVTEQERSDLKDSIVVKMMPFSEKLVRFVTHHNLDSGEAELALKKFKYVLAELSQQS